MCLTRDEIKNIKEEMLLASTSMKKRILVCGGTGCIVNGSLKVYEEFVRLLKEQGINITVDLKKEDIGKADISVVKSGCQSFCQVGPLVTILPDEILYVKVKPEDVAEIIEKSIKSDGIVNRLLYVDPNTNKECKWTDEIPFYAKQHRLVFKQLGETDAESIKEYIMNDGYLMACKAVFDMTDEQICKEILDSGLRGRGGGGFPTGLKWDLTRKEKADKKYVICNGDEGDPGAFMDRSVMEGNPHAVIEGMMITAMAIGADEGVVYVRIEYPLAVERMEEAIKKAEELGILGDNIFGSGKKFKISVMKGAGAFVCGEETALIASVEGKRGMPKPKPPFPAQKGLFDKPTVINNVETLANIPIILRMGAMEFKKIGTASSSGTKIFAISGHVLNTGIVEVPFGATLSQIIGEIAGGVVDKNGKVNNDSFKAVQIGGPSGACLTKKEWDLKLDYETLKAIGAMVGSGGLVVMNDSSCMVSIADFFLDFTQKESCGKCVPCREGTKQMKRILEDIRKGKATEDTLELLKNLAKNIQIASLCGLGKTAPNPVLSTLKNFPDEYKAHVVDKKCPAGECLELVKYEIDKAKCIGCTACAKKCPVGAITGSLKSAHTIDQNKCIKCGVCETVCKFDAVRRG